MSESASEISSATVCCDSRRRVVGNVSETGMGDGCAWVVASGFRRGSGVGGVLAMVSVLYEYEWESEICSDRRRAYPSDGLGAHATLTDHC